MKKFSKSVLTLIGESCIFVKTERSKVNRMEQDLSNLHEGGKCKTLTVILRSFIKHIVIPQVVRDGWRCLKWIQ